jgi:glycerol-3-phosphate dehydrogenase (NAD(P)+)
MPTIEQGDAEGGIERRVRTLTVVGAGAWGTTLAALASRRATTTLWAREPEVVTSIAEHGENRLFLEGLALPAGLHATTSLDDALADADAVIVAVPTQHVRAVMTAAAPLLRGRPLILSVAKGIEAGTGERVSEVLADVLDAADAGPIGVLAGPNLAREIMAGHPAATTVAFRELAAAASIQRLLVGPTFRVYTSTDIVGCEIGGAVKNVIAIAAGVADGLGCGTNTMAALITRGLAEMTRLGVRLGGDPLTFLGLAGNGDLIATCSSPQSRNHQVGRALAAGESVADIVGRARSVAEGVATAPVVVELARRHGVEAPICETVLAMVEDRLAPDQAIATLMERKPTMELHGLADR